MIKAIYRRRDDGDYDFVAAFETEQLPEPPSNWPEEITEWLNAEGELPLVVENIDLQKLPDVWVFKNAGTANESSSPTAADGNGGAERKR